MTTTRAWKVGRGWFGMAALGALSMACSSSHGTAGTDPGDAAGSRSASDGDRLVRDAGGPDRSIPAIDGAADGALDWALDGATDAAAMEARDAPPTPCDDGFIEEGDACVRWTPVASLPEACGPCSAWPSDGGVAVRPWIHGHGSVGVRCNGGAYDYVAVRDAWEPVEDGWGEVLDAYASLPAADPGLLRVYPVSSYVDTVVLTTSLYSSEWSAARYLHLQARWVDAADPSYDVQPVIAIPTADGSLFVGCSDGTGHPRSAIYQRRPRP